MYSQNGIFCGIPEIKIYTASMQQPKRKLLKTKLSGNSRAYTPIRIKSFIAIAPCSKKVSSPIAYSLPDQFANGSTPTNPSSTKAQKTPNYTHFFMSEPSIIISVSPS